ncbi:SCP-like protein [Oesophagostomum dentatum]|uniref:SCP-like protein n=1 Tax=Oesophagostomum dentatum TaxID=61180 RepID=A0A0B1T350_OESDE|nr:SCP-like protein [Oesophagostomum dentatum]
MLKLPVFLTTITWLLLAAGADAAARCQDGVVENADVEVILSTINNVRAKVLKGEQRNGLSGTFLPQARSMPNLTWDCEAEKEATKVLIFSCNGTGTPAGNPTPSLVFVDSKSMHIAKVLNFHLDEAEFEELTKADGDNVIYNNEPDLLVFASMVREGTTKVGCSKVACEYMPGSVAYSYACVTDQS